MKRLVKNNGFTLVELLVVLFILAVVGTVAFGIIIGTLRGANKTTSINNIRQNGNYVVGQMTKMISYLEFEGVSADGTNFDKTCITPITNGVAVKMQTFDDIPKTIVYSCSGNTIASNGASLIDTNSVQVSSCQISCTGSGTVISPIIKITFTLESNGLTAENKSSINFETSVKPRNNF